MADPSHALRPIVIVVDDDPDVLSSLQFAFEVEGFEVWPFASGEALLDLCGVVDQGCLVVDYHLGGLDGLALLERLRAQGSRLPAILITTADPVVALKAAQAGVDVVEKPLLSDTLIEEVRRLLAVGLDPGPNQSGDRPAAISSLAPEGCAAAAPGERNPGRDAQRRDGGCAEQCPVHPRLIDFGRERL